MELVVLGIVRGKLCIEFNVLETISIKQVAASNKPESPSSQRHDCHDRESKIGVEFCPLMVECNRIVAPAHKYHQLDHKWARIRSNQYRGRLFQVVICTRSKARM